MKLVVFVLLGLLCSLSRADLYALSKFQGPPFTVKPTSGIYEIGNLGLNNLLNGAQVIAYGDFDNNKYTDIVTLDDSLRTLTVWTYSHEDYTFSKLVDITPSNTVAAVIPGDFNYDGKLDMLIVTQTSQTSVNTNLEYFFQVEGFPYFGASSNQPHLQKEIVGDGTHPFVLDIDNDKKLETMFMEGGERKLHSIDITEMKFVEKSFSDYVSSAPECRSYNDVSNYNISNPHSNSIIDFNGDCAGDLFITSLDSHGSLTFEIWLMNPNDGKFCLVDVQTITSTISTVSFGDINADGRYDMIFAFVPEKLTESMSLAILYNAFPGDSSKTCTLQSTEMRSPFPTSSALNSQQSISGASQVISFSQRFSPGTRFFTKDSTNRPSRIRVGDVNIDGYADLLMVVNDPEANHATYGTVTLLINQEGAFTFDPFARRTEDKGYYTILDDDVLTSSGDTSIEVLPVIYASFFDFDEFGKLGMWLVTQGKTDPATIPIGIFNFVESESFFLKTLGLSGYKAGDGDDIGPSLGNIYYGTSIECKVTDVLGGSRLVKGNQLPQSGYSPLDLPYIFVGLGRTNNYVENFAVGISAQKDATGLQQSSWSPIIPNSQLIINPLVNSKWTLDVYVNPASDTLLIVFTTIVILVLMGTYILYLKAQEEKEDREKRDPYSMFRKF